MRPSTQRLVSIFLSLVLLLVFSYLVFNINLPKWRVVQGLRREVSNKETVRSQVEKIRSEVQDFLGRSEEIDRESLPIHQALPTQPNFHEVLAIIAAVSAQYQISFSKIDFEQEPQLQQAESAAAVEGRSFRTPPQSFTVSILAAGEYSNFQKWLEALETERRLLDLSVLSIRSFPEEAAERRLLYDIRFTSYFQPPVEAEFHFEAPAQ